MTDASTRRMLEDLAVAEARRVLSEAGLRADPALVAQGWQRRFIADGRRADEAVALYRALGFEVRVEPLRGNEVGPECDDCQLIALQRFRTIYTRRSKEGRR